MDDKYFSELKEGPSPMLMGNEGIATKKVKKNRNMNMEEEISGGFFFEEIQLARACKSIVRKHVQRRSMLVNMM